MPLRLAIEAANRFIAAVGGRSLPSPPPDASPNSTLSPAAASSPSLPMMRRAESQTASIAPIISCLPSTTSSSRHSISAVTPGSTRAGSARSSTPNSARPRSVGTMFFSRVVRNPCFSQPGDDLRPGRRRADPLGRLETIPQSLVLDEAPGVLHRLDQRALLVAWRRPGFLVLDPGIAQPRGLLVA